MAIVDERLGTRWNSDTELETRIGVVPTDKPSSIDELNGFERELVKSLRRMGLRVTENYAQYRSNASLDFGTFFFSDALGKKKTEISLRDERTLELLKIGGKKVLGAVDVMLTVGIDVYPTKRIYDGGVDGAISSMQFANCLYYDGLKKYLPSFTKDRQLLYIVPQHA
ncbi:MAG: hypothetical protein KGH58_00265 [Candidatus Micrarchaeota archaeon]|nr:hypothetical protein [Candidatus Micrarchaeota archaeon]